MRAAVVGGGIAGLATAAALRRSGIAATVYSENIVQVSGSSIDTVGPLGLGLWTNALRCLDLLDPKALASLAATGRWMGDASYRERDGRWIAGPSRPLASGCAAGVPAMLFVSHAELQASLESLLPPESIILHDSRVKRFVSAAGDENGLQLVFEDGSTSEESFDLLVGADGRHSAVRRQLAVEASARQLMQLTTGKRRLASGEITPYALQNMGYVVFRGLACGHCGDGGSFQTWGGDGRRFAAVPMSEGRHSWFATIPVDSVERIDDFDWTDPLRWLQSSYGQWHQPIPALLASTEPDRVTWESAVAHRVNGKEFGDVLDLDLAYQGSRADCGVALVGDAAHTHDPLLAQGAGRAIEGAVGLAAAVVRWQSAAGIAAGTGQPPPLQDAIVMEAAAQRQRDGLLQVVGDVAALMGQAGQFTRHASSVTNLFPWPPHTTTVDGQLRSALQSFHRALAAQERYVLRYCS